ncbi:hypothetical protein FHS00_000217 [Limimaricola variabilis]|uniref:Uncharacterized protein n=1 Tax=Limimaricola variabilis TaxID=1492771 RepID=A0ABR6HJE9_9RHOB|nr:hypothetical protein [Limimaricola variabilis]MBB3710664.1 hypothetical protein [Limimaricola variabilis]
MIRERVTDSIAHFIGTFELAEEAARLRADYDSFRAAQLQDQELGPLVFEGLRLIQKYKIEDLDPKVKYTPLPPPYAPREAELPPLRLPPDEKIDLLPPTPVRQQDEVKLEQTGSEGVTPEMPPPSSVATVTISEIWLDDSDLFGILNPADLARALQNAMQMDGALRTLADQLDELAPFAAPLAGILAKAGAGFDWAGMTEEIMVKAASLEGGALGAVVLRGEAAQGLHLDGVSVEELPDWMTLRPIYQRLKDPDEDGREPGNAPADSFEARFAEAMRGPGGEAGPVSYREDLPTHQLVTGGNTAINSASINSDWLDAPVIVVEGYARNFDAISQVNLLFNRDNGPSASMESGPSLAHNAAQITTVSNVASTGGWMGGPMGYAIARIEGDLVQINTVQQYNFVNDTDHVRISFGGYELRLGTGDNSLANIATLNQFGWNFDVIFVGGNMIDMNIVRQANLLLDDDQITGTVGATGPGGAGAAPAVGGKKLDAGSDSVHSSKKTLEIGGDKAGGSSKAVDGSSKSAADLKGVEGPKGNGSDKTAPKTTEVAKAPAAEPAPANLLYNEARIETKGVDTAAEMPNALSNASKALTGGAQQIGQDVLGLDFFDGVEFLKVLVIEGDFITLNWIDQINVMGDSDMVDALQGELAAKDGAQIITDSNLLANLASINDQGVDSQIMAKGGTYDDALLHQAGLIDETAAPQGVGMAALANEAVAFLAEGMVDGAEGLAAGTMEDAIAAGDAATQAGLAGAQAGQADLMQTMLS